MTQARSARALLLACFLISGFTALCYQTVWMRLALARFGVNASVAATVLAVFMLGLAAGSFGAGALLDRLSRRFSLSPLKVYALAELVIAIGGIVVPGALARARDALLWAGPATGAAYTLASTAALIVILLPFCAAMGLTFPSAVAFLRSTGASGTRRDPFSALYAANVVGALAGAVVTPLVLVELLGFLATSRVAAIGNVAIAVVAFTAFRRVTPELPAAGASRASAPRADAGSRARRLALFVTGFTTMGLEVVWMRTFPTLVGTFVYSFALIIASYLLATTVGSVVYRRLRHLPLEERLGLVWPWLVASAVLPLYSASITLRLGHPGLRVFLGLAPFCALLGYLTPLLVDREAGDDPARVGRAYGINLAGCLLGPVVAGFVLLPFLGTRGATLVLALPLALMTFVRPFSLGAGWGPGLLAGAAAALLWFATTLFEEQFPKRQVRHDHVATVVAASDGEKKHLFVNGVGMTELTTITKMMAHLPAAHLDRQGGGPLDALVVCFGMGTSFRSLASWGANVTAVELVPSVTAMFGYYFPDGPALLRSTERSMRLVHNDGRRFLDRTKDRFDVITIDPPPPVEAAGSSLLYSREFYASARRRMKPGAILQTWLPGGDRETVAGVTLSLMDSFPHVRAFGSIHGFGYHFLASDTPIPRDDAATLVGRMPSSAVRDVTEWISAPPARFFTAMLEGEYDPVSLLVDGRSASTVAITDDRPVNEFFALRHLRAGAWRAPRGEAGPH